MEEFRTGIRGLIGEFISRRLIGVAFLLAFAAVPLGHFLFANISQSRSLALVVAITGLTSFSNAAIWARDTRFIQLLQWPVRRRTLACASLLVGCILFVAEFAVPDLALFASAGMPVITVLGTVLCLILAYGAVWSTLLFDCKAQWVAPLVLTLAFSLISFFVSNFILGAVAAIVVLGGIRFAKAPPRLESGISRPASLFSNYFLVSVFSDIRIWVNSGAVLAFSTIFMIFSRGYPMATPLGLSVPLSASVLTTMISREPDTIRVARMLGAERKIFWQYFVLLFAYFIIVSSPLLILTTMFNRSSVLVFPLMVITALVASGMYAYCEVFHPLVGVRTEKEVLKHPRQYLVLMFNAFLLISGFIFIC